MGHGVLDRAATRADPVIHRTRVPASFTGGSAVRIVVVCGGSLSLDIGPVLAGRLPAVSAYACVNSGDSPV